METTLKLISHLDKAVFGFGPLALKLNINVLLLVRCIHVSKGFSWFAVFKTLAY